MPIIYNNTPFGLRGTGAAFAGQGLAAQADAQRAEYERAQLLESLGSLGGTVAGGITDYKERKYAEESAAAGRSQDLEDTAAKYQHDEDMAHLRAVLSENAAAQKHQYEVEDRDAASGAWTDLLGGGQAGPYGRAMGVEAPSNGLPNGLMAPQSPARGGMPAGLMAQPGWSPPVSGGYQPRPAPQQAGVRMVGDPLGHIPPERWQAFAGQLGAMGKPIPAEVWKRAFPEPPTPMTAQQQAALELSRDRLGLDRSRIKSSEEMAKERLQLDRSRLDFQKQPKPTSAHDQALEQKWIRDEDAGAERRGLDKKRFALDEQKAARDEERAKNPPLTAAQRIEQDYGDALVQGLSGEDIISILDSGKPDPENPLADAKVDPRAKPLVSALLASRRSSAEMMHLANILTIADTDKTHGRLIKLLRTRSMEKYAQEIAGQGRYPGEPMPTGKSAPAADDATIQKLIEQGLTDEEIEQRLGGSMGRQ